ncbi:MAG: hypothetical protein HOH21_04965 [Acidimicrobiaceae bacterium]|jgi:hypothetical protein|nr:hypothetical protein [Acidimicrobiaceae bacterium]MBT6092161.1 hypothetical protein [Acidimicrobiaceae bacterium]
MTEPIHSGRVLQGERQRKARRTTRSGRVLIAAVAIVVGGFLLVGCGSETTTTNAGADVAPDLRLTSINGERVALSDYLGQPVAVMFMHSY